MKKEILLLLLVATSVMGQVRAQNTEASILSARDSVAYQTTFYFQQGIGDWIQKHDYTTMYRLIRWAKSNTSIPIEITGWTDMSGTEELNQDISLRRARIIRDYLVKQGISSERITFEGVGVDTQAESDDKARRADVRGVIRLVVAAEPEPKPESEPKETTPVVIPQPTLEAQPQQPEQPRAEAQPESEPKETTPVVIPQPTHEAQPAEPKKSATQPTVITSQTASVTEQVRARNTSKSQPSAKQRWYVGIEGGVSLGISTFSSFATKGGIDWNVGVMGGYRFSPLLSLEVGAMYGTIKLGASKCCEDYFLGADGVRYLGNVAGMKSYSYKKIHSSVSVQQYALRLNVDMLQLVNSDWDKRWSLSVSPAIYGVNTTADLKRGTTTIIKRSSQFQFGAGAGIGMGYQITDNLGLGVRSGAVWVFGERYDGISPTNHNENIIWNNTLSLTWRFGKMKNE